MNSIPFFSLHVDLIGLAAAVRDKLQRANLVADPHASASASQPISDVGFTGGCSCMS